MGFRSKAYLGPCFLSMLGANAYILELGDKTLEAVFYLLGQLRIKLSSLLFSTLATLGITA
jgi:hypothetical protein